MIFASFLVFSTLFRIYFTIFVGKYNMNNGTKNRDYQ